jgi:glycerol-3-phosphate cytidylyltransferase
MKIGYATGVWDLFHIGHLNLLKYAKEHCDKLIIGVTTDELSLSFKGKKPIIPLDERMEILRAIKYVDEVVLQEDMDKFNAWKKFKFDVMFASDNPTKKWPKVEAEFRKKFEDEGLKPPEILRAPYTPGLSSTSIRELLKKSLK